MAARFERKEQEPGSSVWVRKYRNLHNLPHWHLEHELIACRGGSAVVVMDGVSMSLQDGMAAFCPSGTVHRIDAEDSATLLVAQVMPELVPFLGADIRLQTPVFADRCGVYNSIEEILQELNMQQPYCLQRSAALMTRLLIDIFRAEPRAMPDAIHDRRKSRKTLTQYRELLNIIDADSEFLTFSDAAARMHMSEAHFSRFFRHTSGMTFSDYLNLVKVDKAIGILKAEPQIPTSDLALRCGFNTLRSFNRVFRKITGFSPKQLPEDFSLNLRQYTAGREIFDPTLEDTVTLTAPQKPKT